MHVNRRREQRRRCVAKRPPALRARKSVLHEAEPLRLRPFSAVPPRVLLIGSSTGGPQALTALIEKLPAAVDRAPVLIAQHMPPMFTTVLAEHLSRVGGRGAHEAEDGEPVLAGGIYVAPGGRHMRVVRDGGGIRIALGDDPPINFCKPAVDALFGSAVPVWGAATLALVLTGMGADGSRGAADIVAAGGSIIAQDEATQRGVGHAARRGAGRLVLGGTAARSDRAENHSPVLGSAFVTPLDYDFLRTCSEGAFRPRALGRQAISGRKQAACRLPAKPAWPISASSWRRSSWRKIRH